MKSKKNNLPFLASKARLYNLYEISMDDESFIEIAFTIWKRIGNGGSTHSTIATVPISGIVDLPTNCDFIKSVSVYDNIFNEHDIHTDSGGEYANMYVSKDMMTDVATERRGEDQITGARVHYTHEGDYIHISAPTMYDRRVAIVYTAIDKDDDGLPLLNDREVEAIALGVLVKILEKRLLQGIEGSVQTLNYFKPLAEKAITVARITEYINDDQVDRILDVTHSHNRKVYGKRFTY